MSGSLLSVLYCRPLVIEQVCELFSLVPDLEVESEEYQVLTKINVKIPSFVQKFKSGIS